jgi:Transposase DDE domain
MLGDKAYDSAELREDLHKRGTKPVIPNRCNRKQPFSFNKRIYKLRWRIESAFNRLKDFRRIATRYDRLARNYLASVCLNRDRVDAAGGVRRVNIRRYAEPGVDIGRARTSHRIAPSLCCLGVGEDREHVLERTGA